MSLILLPVRESDIDYLISLSERVNHQALNDALLLNKDHRLPHLTLTMLHANATHELLHESMIGKREEVMLKPETYTYTPSLNRHIQWAVPVVTSNILTLHQKAMTVRKRHHVNTEISNEKCGWIDRFKEHSGSQYQPHFTLGYGDCNITTDGRTIPCEVALALLGQHCTVQQIIS